MSWDSATGFAGLFVAGDLLYPFLGAGLLACLPVYLARQYRKVQHAVRIGFSIAFVAALTWAVISIGEFHHAKLPNF